MVTQVRQVDLVAASRLGVLMAGYRKVVLGLLLGQHIIMAGLLILPLQVAQRLRRVHRVVLGLNIRQLGLQPLVGHLVGLVHILGHEAHGVRDAGHAVGNVLGERRHRLNRGDRERSIVKKLGLAHFLNRFLLSFAGLNQILLSLSDTLRRLDVILRGLIFNVPDFLLGLLYILGALSFGVGLGELLILGLLKVLVGFGELFGGLLICLGRVLTQLRQLLLGFGDVHGGVLAVGLSLTKLIEGSQGVLVDPQPYVPVGGCGVEGGLNLGGDTTPPDSLLQLLRNAQNLLCGWFPQLLTERVVAEERVGEGEGLVNHRLRHTELVGVLAHLSLVRTTQRTTNSPVDAVGGQAGGVEALAWCGGRHRTPGCPCARPWPAHGGAVAVGLTKVTSQPVAGIFIGARQVHEVREATTVQRPGSTANRHTLPGVATRLNKRAVRQHHGGVAIGAAAVVVPAHNQLVAVATARLEALGRQPRALVDGGHAGIKRVKPKVGVDACGYRARAVKRRRRESAHHVRPVVVRAENALDFLRLGAPTVGKARKFLRQPSKDSAFIARIDTGKGTVELVGRTGVDHPLFGIQTCQRHTRSCYTQEPVSHVGARPRTRKLIAGVTTVRETGNCATIGAPWSAADIRPKEASHRIPGTGQAGDEGSLLPVRHPVNRLGGVLGFTPHPGRVTIHHRHGVMVIHALKLSVSILHTGIQQ